MVNYFYLNTQKRRWHHRFNNGNNLKHKNINDRGSFSLKVKKKESDKITEKKSLDCILNLK